MLTFSVVTPSFNQGAFVERTVQSVLSQDYPALEYVVCDGGSTDETPHVLEQYRGRLRLSVEPDNGQSHAVNKGIRATSGELIGWLNSDDIYRPGALSTVAEYFSAHPDVDLVYGQADVIDELDQVIGRYPTEAWDAQALVNRCFLAQPAAFFRRRVVDRFGPLDERLHFCMDYEYWLRLAEGGAIAHHLTTVLAASRRHPVTKTLRDRRAVHAELNSMLKARFGAVPASWLVNEAYTLTELSRLDRAAVRVPFVAQMALTAVLLSWQWNGFVSRELVSDVLGRMVGAARTRLGIRQAASGASMYAPPGVGTLADRGVDTR